MSMNLHDTLTSPAFVGKEASRVVPRDMWQAMWPAMRQLAELCPASPASSLHSAQAARRGERESHEDWVIFTEHGRLGAACPCHDHYICQ